MKGIGEGVVNKMEQGGLERGKADAITAVKKSTDTSTLRLKKLQGEGRSAWMEGIQKEDNWVGSCVEGQL